MLRLAALSAICAVLLAAAPTQAARVSTAVRAATAAGEVVRVFVMLRPAPSAYDDYARRAAAAARQRAVLGALPPTGTSVLRRFETLAAFAADLTPAALRALVAHPDVISIDEIPLGGGALVDSLPRIGAGAAHAQGLRGAGSTIALLDTGVDAAHPDIAGRVVWEECFCLGGCCPEGKSRASGPGSAASRSGHGPHVAGILASNGTVAGEGVAPEAQLVAVRVLDDQNRGSLVDWLSALDWVVASRLDVDVVNLSLVSDTAYTPPCDDLNGITEAFATFLRRLRDRGTVAAAAAGNAGMIGRLPAPACVENAVATGAVDKDDAIASFSNTAIGLDLLAPGVAIVSDAPGGTAQPLSGTSMAAPHVTGSLALLVPLVGRGLRSAVLGDLLGATGLPIADPRLCPGGRCEEFPRVDVEAAAAWLSGATALHPGGGSTLVDCQLEWRLPAGRITPYPGSPRVRCVDGDPACDADDLPGQCTFDVAACFNVPDLRFDACDPGGPLSAYRLIHPSPFAPGDQTDAANVSSILSVMPPLPITRAAQCTEALSFVVPRDARRGVRSIRLAAESARGRDADRVWFTCLAPQ